MTPGGRTEKWADGWKNGRTFSTPDKKGNWYNLRISDHISP